MADVTLTASMRANLFSLQQTAQLMGTVQQKLATGKKVNSALDDPNAYFSAQALSNRAADIGNLLNGMGQAIQVIKAASQGITSAQKLVDQMKAVANSAVESVSSANAATDSQLSATGIIGTKGGSNTVTSASASLTTALNSWKDGLGNTVSDADATLTITSTGTSISVSISSSMSLSDINVAISTAAATASFDEISFQIDSAGHLSVKGDAAAAVTLSGTGYSMLADTTGIGATVGLSGTTTGGTAILTSTAASSAVLTATNNSAGNSLGIVSGDTINIVDSTAATSVTVTVTNTTTAQELLSQIENSGLGGGNMMVGMAGNGTIDLGATNALTVSGTLATKLGLGNTTAGTTVQSTQTYYQTYTAPAASADTKLVNLTLQSGKAITDGTLTGSIASGDSFTMAIGSGSAETFSVNSTTTVQDLADWFDAVSDGEVALTVSNTGTIKLTNNTGATLDFTDTQGVLSKTFGATVSVGTSTGSYQEASIYANVGDLTVNNSTDLSSLNSATTALSSGDTLTVNTGGATTTLTYGTASNQVSTVGELLTQLNNIGGVVATVDGAGKLNVALTNGETLTLGGNLQAKLGLDASSSSANSAPAASYIKQFDTLRTQLDTLVKDAAYQGTNLISGANNSPLTVVFNEAASNASKLIINSVDLTSEGLNLDGASGAWTSVSGVQASLTALTNAASTLRTQAQELGTNLATVQTRQDFANNMIATLKEGADKLTLADMNEEGANMLALQTRSQLGTQSLSLASQNNQSVMRLFG